MATIKVSVSVEIVESDGHTVSYTEALPNVATGGNPGFFTQDVEIGLGAVSEKVSRAVAGRFGDLREREGWDERRSNYVRRTFA